MKLQSFFASKPIILSPMAGVTDFAFRALANKYGADLTISEMVSAKAIAMHNAKTYDLLHYLKSESPKAVQLFGHEPKALEKAAQDAHLASFDIIDFNCGCPAPKIVSNGDGCALMANIDLARQCITSLVQHASKPVSVKFRLGINNVENYIEFGKMCEECGVSFVTLHPRTREQGYSGQADYEAVKKLKSILHIPVVLSGDVKDKTSLEKAWATGADGVMIGRASMGKPWIFNELKNKNIPNAKIVAKKHLDLLAAHYKNEQYLVPYFRKHLAWYVSGNDNATKLKNEIFHINNLNQLKIFIKNI